MLWNTSETVAYLDANYDQLELDGDEIEVYEPDPAGRQSPDPAGTRPAGRAARLRTRWNTPVGPGAQLDPAARAGNTAARAVNRIKAPTPYGSTAGGTARACR